MNGLTLQETGQLIGIITGAIGILILLWRYLVFPAVRLLKKLQINSEKIVNSLPVLFDLSSRWPLQSQRSLSNFLDNISIDIARQRVAYRLLLDHFNMAAFETDENGKCIWVSEQWRKITHLTIEEANGSVWLAGVSENDREKVTEEWFRCVEMQRPFNLHYSLVDKEGKVTPVHGIGHTIKNEGKFVGYFGLIKPI